MQEKHDIAVIGAGAAGSMGVLRSVLNNKQTIVFKGSRATNKRSRAMWVRKVVNMPLMFDRKRAITESVDEVFDWIVADEYFSKKLTSIDEEAVNIIKLEDGNFEITAATGEKYISKFVLLCTGIMDVQPEIQGSIKPILPFANKGDVDYCIRCDGHKVINKVAATIGHTSTAAWVAALLQERYQPKELKIFLNGKKADWEGNTELEDLISLYKIKIVSGEILSIKADDKKSMQSFEIQDSDGIYEETVEIAFPMLGQIAYNDLAKQVSAELNEKGNVITNEKGESSVENFYVAGDLRQGKKYQIYTAWDMAVDSVDDMDAKLRREYRESLKVSASAASS